MTFCGCSVDFATFIENETTPHGAAAHASAARTPTTIKLTAFIIFSVRQTRNGTN